MAHDRGWQVAIRKRYERGEHSPLGNVRLRAEPDETGDERHHERTGVIEAQPTQQLHWELDGRTLGHALRLERGLVVERRAAVVEALLVRRQAGALVDARLELTGRVARLAVRGCM